MVVRDSSSLGSFTSFKKGGVHEEVGTSWEIYSWEEEGIEDRGHIHIIITSTHMNFPSRPKRNHVIYFSHISGVEGKRKWGFTIWVFLKLSSEGLSLLIWQAHSNKLFTHNPPHPLIKFLYHSHYSPHIIPCHLHFANFIIIRRGMWFATTDWENSPGVRYTPYHGWLLERRTRGISLKPPSYAYSIKALGSIHGKLGWFDHPILNGREYRLNLGLWKATLTWTCS